MGRTRDRGVGLSVLQGALEVLKANNYNGALYLPRNIDALNQLSTGTTPVASVTDPIGLQLDERFGLALGPELVTDPTFDNPAAWTKDAGWDVAGGVATATGAGVGTAVYQAMSPVIGRAYVITYTISGYVGGTAAPTFFNGNNGAGASSNGTYTQTLICTSALGLFGIFSASAFTGVIDNISVRLLDGNHSTQSTAAARLTWQVDANGRYYLEALGTDDCFTSATGGGGTLGFFWCGAIQPTGGAGTARILWDDRGANTGYLVFLETTGTVGLRAGNGAAYTTRMSTDATSVGTKSLLTVWDDGTNLNVQVNNGTVLSTARPVVAAGSAGFTRFKSNLAASDYFIGYEYASCYVKDSGLTAPERAAIQALIASCAGITL